MPVDFLHYFHKVALLVGILLLLPLDTHAKPLLIAPNSSSLQLINRNFACYSQSKTTSLVSIKKSGKKLLATKIRVATIRSTIRSLERSLRRIQKSRGSSYQRKQVNRELNRNKRTLEFYEFCQSLDVPSDDGGDNEGGGDQAPPPPQSTPTPSPTPSPTATSTPEAPDLLPQTDIISQYGIEFIFDKPYPYGQFANGDYFVVGPVVITAITPNFTGTRNGLEVNPNSYTQQGFDDRIAGFKPERVPSFPLSVSTDASIVKTISLPNCSGTCLNTAAVLTVLTAPPSGGGSLYFRPGYAGTAKQLIPIADIDTSLLPSLSPVGNTPSYSTVRERFSRVWLDHLTDWVARAMHPLLNMPDYGAAMAIQTNEAALRFMLNDPSPDRLPALVNFLQYGLDLSSMLAIGTTFSANGGHSLGRLIVLSMTATLLNRDSIRQQVLELPLSAFHENGSVTVGQSGQALWGQGGSEYDYWYNQVTDNGSRTVKDPYGYIDGGYEPGGSYAFCCNNQPFKGMALALRLMPKLQEVWNYPPFLEYVDRTVTSGAIAQPDPCAPHDGNMANYGITFGPDGNGGCIQGPGRHPQLHGSNADSGYYGSGFVNSMWSAYR